MEREGVREEGIMVIGAFSKHLAGIKEGSFDEAWCVVDLNMLARGVLREKDNNFFGDKNEVSCFKVGEIQ